MERDPRVQSLLSEIAEQSLSRRDVLKRAVALGLSAPAIAALLAACGGEGAPEATEPAGGGTQESPTTETEESPQAETGKRGGGGELRLLWWQAPTILNCHLSSGTKDFDAARVCLEPLADLDADSNLVPVLAAEIPSLDNGQLAEDGKSVTWKLKQGVKWHDGTEFTAKDVKFTFDWVSDEKVAATTSGTYLQVESVEVVDDYTAKVNFTDTNPDWFSPFTGADGVLIPEHIMKDYMGENARNAPFNLKPIGTGAYKVVDFKPGDVVLYEINQDYWEDGKPHFDSITMKGGGDATSAARSVLQTAEMDWAWNIQVEDAVLTQLEQGGQGTVVAWAGGGTEKMLINRSDPQTEQDGQRSHKDVPHPHFQELKVRQALNLAVDREAVAGQLYGRAGEPTPFAQNKVLHIFPEGIQYEYNLDQAAALLDEAGATPGPDGIRTLNDRPMKWLYQTSVNSIRQKHQEIVKRSLGEIGVQIEIKSIDASVYFSGDPGSEDTTNHFYADIEMYTNSPGSPFPILWFQRYLSTEIAQKENQWAKDNYARYNNPEFDELYNQVAKELDEDKSTELFKQMMQLIWDDVVELGVVARNNVACVSNTIKGYTPTQWAGDTYDVKNWYREE